MANKGQNLIEFLILLTLVVIGIIFGLTLLGGNVNSLFSKSHKEVTLFQPFGTSVEAATTATTNQITVDGITVSYNNEGAASFEIDGQKIQLSSSDIASLNDVFNTVGGNGINDEVIAAFRSLISAHSDEYEDIPIQLTFGTVSRQEYPCNQYAYTYLPANDHNVVIFSVEDHQVMLQKDQDCKGPVTCDLVHRMEFNGSSRADLETESEYMNGYDLVDVAYTDSGNPKSAYLSRPGEFGSPGAGWWFEWD